MANSFDYCYSVAVAAAVVGGADMGRSCNSRRCATHSPDDVQRARRDC